LYGGGYQSEAPTSNVMGGEIVGEDDVADLEHGDEDLCHWCAVCRSEEGPKKCV